ncbi:MAG: hypothetical protein RL154_1695, partial [Pseudomonadota bacterium]
NLSTQNKCTIDKQSIVAEKAKLTSDFNKSMKEVDTITK